MIAPRAYRELVEVVETLWGPQMACLVSTWVLHVSLGSFWGVFGRQVAEPPMIVEEPKAYGNFMGPQWRLPGFRLGLAGSLRIQWLSLP